MPAPSTTDLRAELERYFKFLDRVRSSGATNMYGAAPYLEDAFDLSRDEARRILMAWMRTFDGVTSAADRAASVEAL